MAHPDVTSDGKVASFYKMMRFMIASALFLMTAILWFSNNYFTTRFTESARIDAAVRSTLYSGNIAAALEKQRVIPLILAKDQTLITALQTSTFQNTSRHLISFLEETEAASVFLLDKDGRTVAASDRRLIGTDYSTQPYFSQALRLTSTSFTSIKPDQDQPGFFFSRRIGESATTLGVIVVQADLQRLEERWGGRRRQVFVTDSEDNVLLSSNPLWKNSKIQDFITDNATSAPGTRVLDFNFNRRNQAFSYVDGNALLRVETKIGFQGWKLNYLETLEGVRARVNGILAMETMVFAIIAAFAFYLLSRASTRVSRRLRKESEDLRLLNSRLQQEISERKKAEKNLEVAEQSLAQQSKLAALGQMSAAVSHELNQPLAAMRTYLAGARLLLQRKRPDEAESSFQRVEDLLDRMGAITRQLKSFARKSTDDMIPVDVKVPLSAAFSMMAPQLGQGGIEITRTVPDEPAMVMADPLRIEQIIVNLLRNALDAMKSVDRPHIDILLTIGDTVTLAVRDCGHGIADPENLFEPFYTTKKPGEGVGLGLAISAGIASELGGRLTARNRDGGGATFELQLPRIGAEPLAAE